MMRKIFIISFLLLLGLVACVKKEEFEKITPVNYTGEWGVPFVNSSITFDELLKQYQKTSEIPVKIITDKDNVYHLIYKDSIESPAMETYYKLQDFSFDGKLEIPADKKTFLPTDIPFPFSTTVNFDTLLSEEMSIPLDFEDKPINAQIKYIDLSDGLLSLDIQSKFQHNVQLMLTMNSFTKDGVPLKIPVDLNNPSTGTMILPKINRSLAGYRFDLTNGGKSIDSVFFHVDVAFTTTAGKSISVDDNISIKLKISKMKYYAIVGKLGKFKIPLEKGDMRINLFDENSDLSKPKITIQEPKIDLKFVNQLGVPFGIEFKELALENADGVKKDIELADGKEVFVGHVTGIENLGDSVTTLFGLTDETTKNFSNAFAIAPNHFKYEMMAIIGDDNNPDFFLHENAKMKVVFDADVPVAGAVENYIFEEEYDDLALGDIDTSMVDYAELRFIANNGWPFTIDIQGYFVNDNGQVLDSLFTDGMNTLIQSGTIDVNGFVTAPATKKTIIFLDRKRYRKVSEATKMRYTVKFKTGTDGKQITKILSTYRLGVIMSAKVKMNASFE